MTDDFLVKEIALAVRRQQFARTRRSKVFDETVPPTDNELSDAQTAMIVVLSFLLDNPEVFASMQRSLKLYEETRA